MAKAVWGGSNAGGCTIANFKPHHHVQELMTNIVITSTSEHPDQFPFWKGHWPLCCCHHSPPSPEPVRVWLCCSTAQLLTVDSKKINVEILPQGWAVQWAGLLVLIQALRHWREASQHLYRLKIMGPFMEEVLLTAGKTILK